MTKTKSERKKLVAEALSKDAGGAGTFSNAVIAHSFSSTRLSTEIQLLDVHKQITEGGHEAAKGDLSDLERMLYGQAVALNALFGECVRRAGLNMGEHLQATETYMRMALKAQAQAAHTVKVLGDLKNPRAVAFVRQQTNISSEGGPQQVNVGTQPLAPAPARENEKPSNELLEQSNGDWLDTGAAGQAGRSDTALEAVGAVNRPTDADGQGSIEHERRKARDAGARGPRVDAGRAGLSADV